MKAAAVHYTMRQIAEELGVSIDDVTLVADVELGGPPDYEPDLDGGTVTVEGRRVLIQDFHGGTDPV